MDNEKKVFTTPLLTVFDHKGDLFATSNNTTWEIGKIDLIPDLNMDSSN